MSSMRGLTMFIADLRNSRARELEEKRINKEMGNIRAKFKDGNLNGYQKKKYVCKLLYMYIIGWEIDFGHMEAVSLISSNKYGEKQIGYLAITLMLTENSDLLRLVINSIRKDLENFNEQFNCLALHAIANIGGKELAESLATDVQKLLVSSQSKNFVKKKAALCLLRLFRKHPDVVPAEEWAPRLLNLLDDPDLGVCTSVASLITALAQQFPEAYQEAVPKAVYRLHKIVLGSDYTLEYVYYKVPCPWLQVKLMRLLQYFPPPVQDSTTTQRLSSVLDTLITSDVDKISNPQQSNAHHAVLFEAINLAIHVDPDGVRVQRATHLLGKFIASKETNIRYLGLETMAHLAAVDSVWLTEIKKHQEIIFESLRDKDISVRRRGLDLLYSMCDTTNARPIVAELLKFLVSADFALREEMALKIAILAEKYATDPSWYVDVMIQLIAIAGDAMSDEVWYRVAQIVTNQPSVQAYAVRTVFDAVRVQNCHDAMLKTAAYVMGEFGHLIANERGASPAEQFTALHTKFQVSSDATTRALLLTAYLKMANVFPEIKHELIRIFQQYQSVLDVDLQQRACEYLALCQSQNETLLQHVCDEMPPFAEKAESALVEMLRKRDTDTEDKRTWRVGGRDANQRPSTSDGPGTTRKLVASTTATSQTQSVPATPTNDLLGLEVVKPVNVTAAVKSNPLEDLLGVSNLTSASTTAVPTTTATITGNERQWARLLVISDGVLYEDESIQIGLKSVYQQSSGRVSLFYGNKSSQAVTASAKMSQMEGNVLRVTESQPLTSVIQATSQVQQQYVIECLQPFDQIPTLELVLSHRSFSLRLPIVITKFAEPINLTSSDFFARWRQMGGTKERQVTFRGGQGALPASNAVRSVLLGMRVGVLDGIDPNPVNWCGACVVTTLTGGKVGCLYRLEPNEALQMYRLTVRTTSEIVSTSIVQLLQSVITAL